MAIRLYGAPGSCSFAALIALEQAGVEYELVQIDLASGQQRSGDFIAINPHGRVPALDADGVVITEVLAVLAYIGARFPDSNVLPCRDPELLGQSLEMLGWFSSTIHVQVAQILRGDRFADDQDTRERLKIAGRQRLTASLAELDAKVRDSDKHLIGTSFSSVDAFSLVIWRWAQKLMIDCTAFESWKARAERDLALPQVRLALEAESSAKRLVAHRDLSRVS